MTIFKYFKYHSIRTYTDPNIKATYYGVKINGKGTHFANYFKRKGYIFRRINDFCQKEVITNQNNFSFNEHITKVFLLDAFQHFMIDF